MTCMNDCVQSVNDCCCALLVYVHCEANKLQQLGEATALYYGAGLYQVNNTKHSDMSRS